MILAHASLLAEVGHEVVIVFAALDTVFPIHPRITLEKLESTSKFATLMTALTRRFARADIVIADIIPLACLLDMRNRGKVVYFAQDYDESYYSCAAQKMFVRVLYWIGLSVLKVPVIAVSDKLAELLSNRFCAEVKVVHNGVDERTFFPDPDPDLLQKKSDRLAILVLSRSDQRKGFDLVPRIMEEAKMRTSVGFEIWSVGEACDGKFAGFVHRDFGYVGQDRMRQILSSADVFLYPSRHEGFPLMALEALSCNCAMVTTEAVSVVEHGREALVSRVGDSGSLAEHLVCLLEKATLRRSLASSGMQFVKRFGLKDSSLRFCEELKQILRQR